MTTPTRDTTASISRATALARALRAALAFVAVLVVLPWLVWSWRHNPLPDHLEPQRWTQLAIEGYIAPDVIPDLLAVGIWIVWAQFLLATLLEIIARLSHGVAASRSIVVIAPVQRVVAHLVAALSVVLSAHPAGAAVPGLSPSIVSTATLNDAQVGVDPDTTAATARTDATGVTHYVCGPYDTLRSIAQAVYGNADAWTRIRDASIGQRQDDGTRLPERFVAVAPGTRLVIPAPPTRLVQVAAMTNPATGTPSDAATLEPTTDHHTVRPGETLWGIAGTHYRDAGPADLPRIVDAVTAANTGVTDHHGHRLDDEDTINPGMRLRLPTLTDAEQSTAPQKPPVAAPPTPTPPMPPAGTPGPPSSPPTASPGSPGTLAPTPLPRASTDQIPDPWSLLSPPGHDSAGGRHSSPTSAAAEIPTNANAPTVNVPAIAWLTGGGAGLLATGFVGVWSYRRRRRDAKVRPGQHVPAPDPSRLALHTGLRIAADPDGTQRIDHALRSLSRLHTDPAAPAPLTQVVFRQRTGDIDVLLSEPAPSVPGPWQATSDQRIWRLPAHADLTPHLGDLTGPHPNPTLVQLGRTDDAADLYLDLENIATLAIDDTSAAPDALRALARAVTATLATSPLADIPRIRTTGFDPYGLRAEERLHEHAGISDLIDQTSKDARELQHQLHDHDTATTLALRVRHPDDTTNPTVVIIADPTLTPQDGERLTRLSGTGAQGVATVLPLGAAPHTRWRLVHLPDLPAVGSALDAGRPSPDPMPVTTPGPRWRIDPLGITLYPLTLAADELSALTELLDEAGTPATATEPVRLHIVPATPPGISPNTHPPATDQYVLDHPVNGGKPGPVTNERALRPVETTREQDDEDLVFTGPPWQVMIRLLGPVDLVDPNGRTPDRVRDRTVELLAWLVLHRHGTRAQLEAALWPTGARPGTVSNTLSRARTALEELAGPQAHDWIPGYQSELRINPAVTTDLAILQAHADWAEHQARAHPQAAITALRDGLGLVRGVPEGYPWLDAEHGSTLTTTVTTAAIRLAELCLERGDNNAALRATTNGLAILPAHPELFALRMRARAATGDRTGVRTEYEAYLRAENADPLADGETDRDLEHLYLQLRK